MSYAIARIAKLKKSNLGGSAMHTTRERNTPNADLEKENIRIIDTDSSKSLSELVIDKIDQNPQKRKIERRAVYAVEFVFTTSPDFFRPSEPNNGGFHQADKLYPWVDATKNFLDNEYGDRIVRAELHLDEMTPHIHAYFVPLDANGQLRCSHFFDGRHKLQKFQDSYHQAVKHLGLERGIRGSVAQHEHIKDFYHSVNEGKELELTPLNQSQIISKAVDRDRAVKQELEMEVTAQRLALQNEQLQKQVQLLQMQNQQFQIQIEKEKDLPLKSVARRLGLSENVLTANWEGCGQTLTIEGSNFYNSNQNEKIGSIELVKEIKNCGLDEALSWLGQNFGREGVERSIKANAETIACDLDIDYDLDLETETEMEMEIDQKTTPIPKKEKQLDNDLDFDFD